MAKATPKAPLDSRRVLINWIVALAVLILVGGIWAWFQYIHKSSYGVFWDTIDNNLNLYGVTRQVEQGSETSSIDQMLQISLGANNIARGVTTVTQSDEKGSNIVVTESIGTPKYNFVRYDSINTTSGADVSSVQNVWAKDLLVTEGRPNDSIFAEGTLFSSIPVALLNQRQRQEVVTILKETNAYEVDYENVKVVERAGKRAYEYSVTVNLPGYLAATKRIDEMMNLNQLTQLDPRAFEGSEPRKITVVASIDSRQLLEVTYDGAARRETFSGYGAQIPVAIPETNVMRSDLESKVQQLFGTAGGM